MSVMTNQNQRFFVFSHSKGRKHNHKVDIINLSSFPIAISLVLQSTIKYKSLSYFHIITYSIDLLHNREKQLLLTKSHSKEMIKHNIHTLGKNAFIEERLLVNISN